MEEERRGAYEGKYQFVYVTPEYLATRSMEQLNELHMNCKFCCLAVDEAHCISSWGKGYRDSFLALSRLRSPDSPPEGRPLDCGDSNRIKSCPGEILLGKPALPCTTAAVPAYGDKPCVVAWGRCWLPQPLL